MIKMVHDGWTADEVAAVLGLAPGYVRDCCRAALAEQRKVDDGTIP